MNTATEPIFPRDLTGVHDTDKCGDGHPCDVCVWASSASERRAYAEWNLEAKMNDFIRDYGSEALVERVDQFMTERGLY